MNKHILLFFLGCISLSVELHANEISRVNRYTIIENKVANENNSPLKTPISIAYPASIKTLKQAIVFLLKNSGYKIAPYALTHSSTKIMYNLKIPQVHKKFNYVSIDKILKVLVGSAFAIAIDPIRREISFIPILNYKDKKINFKKIEEGK